MSISDEHIQYSFDVAPYALGALSEADAADFARHLADCEHCQHDLAELTAFAPRLQHAGEIAFEAQTEPPDTLLPRLLAEVRHRRRTSARRLWTLAAVAASLAAILAAIMVPRLTRHPVQRLALQPVSTVSDVQASVSLSTSGSGTKIVLVCSYASTDKFVERPYQLLVSNRFGSSVTLPSWTIRGGDTLTIPFKVPWPRDQIGKITMQTGDGRDILALNL